MYQPLYGPDSSWEKYSTHKIWIRLRPFQRGRPDLVCCTPRGRPGSKRAVHHSHPKADCHRLQTPPVAPGPAHFRLQNKHISIWLFLANSCLNVSAVQPQDNPFQRLNHLCKTLSSVKLKQCEEPNAPRTRRIVGYCGRCMPCCRSIIMAPTSDIMVYSRIHPMQRCCTIGEQ